MQQVIYTIPWTVFGWFPNGIPIYGFGLMLFIAFILCTWLAGWRVKWMIRKGIGLGRYVAGPHEGEDFPAAEKADEKEALNEKVETGKALIQDLAIWLFITGLVGARLTYMYHNDEPGGFWERLIDITKGGIILYGSAIGAAIGYVAFLSYYYWLRDPVRLALWWFFAGLSRVPLLGGVINYIFQPSDTRPEPVGPIVLNTLRIADLVAPAIAIGIGLGRIGCLLNGCCYGHIACAACTLAPAVQFPMSAPPRYVLVEKGYQTAAGFTVEQSEEEGVLVGAVDPNSPAYQVAGLRAGDVIVAVNGERLNASGERGLTDALVGKWPRGGKDVVLTVIKPTGADAEQTLPVFRPLTLGLYPTQLFETVSMALLFLLLTAFFAYRRHDGQVMALLMMCYAVHRTLNEILRDDVRPVGFEAYSSYILFAAGLVLMIWVMWWRPVEYKSEWELAT